MNRTAKLSGGLASLGMAAGLLFTPAAASADAETALTPPVVLKFENTAYSRDTPGTVSFTPPKPAVSVSAGSWSGYVQFSDGSVVTFCPSETVNLNSRPAKKLFVSASTGSCP
ncbi:hypothetical protein [Streptosporangium vulgare]|uniref:Uncharacterized protein n=1 Tax=Streptosporangium vulgare TaxID=46190 RepID=A0ABV5T691_9ACTN